jgi:hypothetical protein
VLDAVAQRAKGEGMKLVIYVNFVTRVEKSVE